MNPGNIISELRKEKGLRQIDLANYLNVARSTLANWERNENNIDLDSLIKLSDYFNVSTDYILGLTNIRYNLNLENRENAALIIKLYETLKEYEIKKIK